MTKIKLNQKIIEYVKIAENTKSINDLNLYIEEIKKEKNKIEDKIHSTRSINNKKIYDSIYMYLIETINELTNKKKIMNN